MQCPMLINVNLWGLQDIVQVKGLDLFGESISDHLTCWCVARHVELAREALHVCRPLEMVHVCEDRGQTLNDSLLSDDRRLVCAPRVCFSTTVRKK